jgi:hypothetical protein
MTDKEVMQSAMNEHCPACGYYCLGNGGVYCIDKPTTVETTRACLAQPEQYDQTELEFCKKCGWKAVWPDGCLVCEKQEAQPKSAECDGGQCGIGGYCKQCPKTQPEQEPVGWMYSATGTLFDTCPQDADEGEFLPLYTSPPQREWVGLTDDEYELMAEKRVTNYFFNTLDYAHDIEAKLKEKNT